jgi:hypothetical protein
MMPWIELMAGSILMNSLKNRSFGTELKLDFILNSII